MFTKTTQDILSYSDANSEERRKFIDCKLFEFNQARSKQIVECDRLQTKSPKF